MVDQVRQQSNAVSLQEAARRLGVSPATIKRLVRGETPRLWTYYVGRRRLTDEAAIARYKQANSATR